MWILILTMWITGHSGDVTIVKHSFMSKVACETAGQSWRKEQYRGHPNPMHLKPIVNANYVCVQEFIPKKKV